MKRSTAILIVVLLYLGWKHILRKGAYPPEVSRSVKVRHFIALFLICLFSSDFPFVFAWFVKHSANLEEIYSRRFPSFGPTVQILLDLGGAIVGSFCFVLCFSAAKRHTKSLKMFRPAFSLLAVYICFYLFRGLYEKYGAFQSAIVSALATAAPAGVILRFYCRQENFEQLCSNEKSEISPG